jgi:hypothetical protein
MTLFRVLFPRSLNPITRLRDVFRSLRAKPPPSDEFDRLNALSDAELRQMGLTRAVLRRHLHQKRQTARP